jgi:hypothetical protein
MSAERICMADIDGNSFTGRWMLIAVHPEHRDRGVWRRQRGMAEMDRVIWLSRGKYFDMNKQYCLKLTSAVRMQFANC